jgi:hypothetical protein
MTIFLALRRNLWANVGRAEESGFGFFEAWQEQKNDSLEETVSTMSRLRIVCLRRRSRSRSGIGLRAGHDSSHKPSPGNDNHSFALHALKIQRSTAPIPALLQLQDLRKSHFSVINFSVIPSSVQEEGRKIDGRKMGRCGDEFASLD